MRGGASHKHPAVLPRTVMATSAGGTRTVWRLGRPYHRKLWKPACTPQPDMGCPRARAMLPWLVLPLLVRGHGDDDAHTHLVNSIADCPDATWSYRDHRCYKLTDKGLSLIHI